MRDAFGIDRPDLVSKGDFGPVYRDRRASDELFRSMVNEPTTAPPSGSTLRQRLFSAHRIAGYAENGDIKLLDSMHRPLIKRPGVVGAALAGTAAAGGTAYAVKHKKGKRS